MVLRDVLENFVMAALTIQPPVGNLLRSLDSKFIEYYLSKYEIDGDNTILLNIRKISFGLGGLILIVSCSISAIIYLNKSCKFSFEFYLSSIVVFVFISVFGFSKFRKDFRESVKEGFCVFLEVFNPLSLWEKIKMLAFICFAFGGCIYGCSKLLNALSNFGLEVILLALNIP